MQLVGYIAYCKDHEYVVVSPTKPTEQNKDWYGYNVYTSTDEIYSTAVKCHAKGVPAVFEVDKDGIDKKSLVATGIDPIDLTEDDVKERLECIRIAINSAERHVYVLNEYVDEIVGGFLTAFTNYRDFDKKFQEGYSDITCAFHNVEELKEILNKESEQ